MVPEGARDIFPPESERRRAIEERLREVCASFGYRFMETPTLEFLGTASAGLRTEEELYKLIDGRGRVVALRAEFTASVARALAERPQEPLPVRLAYAGEVFRFGAHGRPARQWRQVGVEAIGLGSPLGEIEMCQVAAAAMQAAGIDDVCLTLGHAGMARALVMASGLPPETAEDLVARDRVAFARALATAPPGPARDLLAAVLEGLDGDAFLERAARLGVEQVAQAATALLRWIEQARRLVGGAVRLRFDPLLVRDLTYYTGVLVEGASPRAPQPVASGGRYDGLLARFGRPADALGFALDLDRLVELVPPERFPARPVRLLLGGEAALPLAARWRREGLAVEVLPGGMSAEEAARLARARGAARVFRPDGEEVGA